MSLSVTESKFIPPLPRTAPHGESSYKRPAPRGTVYEVRVEAPGEPDDPRVRLVILRALAAERQHRYEPRPSEIVQSQEDTEALLGLYHLQLRGLLADEE